MVDDNNIVNETNQNNTEISSNYDLNCAGNEGSHANIVRAEHDFIDDIEEICKIFSKRDQRKSGIVRRLQYVVVFLSNEIAEMSMEILGDRSASNNMQLFQLCRYLSWRNALGYCEFLNFNIRVNTL